MKIYDTHLHFWDLSLKKHSWLYHQNEKNFLGDYSAICKNYLYSDFQDDAQNFEIIGFTHVQAGWDKNKSVEETTWVEVQIKKQNLQASIIGYADLTCGAVSNSHVDFNALRETLQNHSQSKNFFGIRQILNWHSNSYFSGCEFNISEHKNFAEGYRTLKDFNLAFELQAYPAQIFALLSLISAEPNIPVVLNHCGMPLFLKHEDVEIWKKAIKEIAQIKHVFMKLSGLGMFQKYSFNFFSQKEIIEFCIEVFGVERCVFGSNFPVDKLFQPYTDTLKPIVECGLNPKDIEKIMHKNALRIYHHENYKD